MYKDAIFGFGIGFGLILASDYIPNVNKEKNNQEFNVNLVYQLPTLNEIINDYINHQENKKNEYNKMVSWFFNRYENVDIMIENYIHEIKEEARNSINNILLNNYSLNEKRSENFSYWIVEASFDNHVPTEILTALVATESSFRYELTSSVGAIGPAQVRPVFWKDYCGVDLTNPSENIYCGARVLAKYRNENCDGDWNCALKMYNVGPSNYYSGNYEGAKKRYISKIENHLNTIASI